MNATSAQITIRDDVFKIAQQMAEQANVSVAAVFKDLVLRRMEFAIAMQPEA